MVEHRSQTGLSNRADNPYLPFSLRVRGVQPPEGLRRFVSVFSAGRNLFVPLRSRRSALATHFHRLNAIAGWKSAAGVPA
jgi:putative transposase